MSSTSGFYLYHSNSLEILADSLALLLEQHQPEAVFQPHVVAVPQKGLGRWLQLRMAERQGISANLNTVLPASLAWQVINDNQAVFAPDSPSDNSIWQREKLRWRILDILTRDPSSLPKEVTRYLLGSPSSLYAYQLADRLADLFDRYLVYRPALIKEWDGASRQSDWQAWMWRALETDQPHRMAMIERFYSAFSGSKQPEGLPEHIYLFGINQMPPVYLSFFRFVSQFVDVHCFTPSPCEEYWADIESEKSLARRLLKNGPSGDDVPGEVGHPLLAALGKNGRDFLRLCLDSTAGDVVLMELIYRNREDTLLGVIQSDITALQSPDQDRAKNLKPDDNSFQVHGHYSRLREIQGLQDQLLQAFDDIPDLNARDIVVMAPHISEYTEYIHTVFGGIKEGDPRGLPYSVADQSGHDAHSLIQVFLSLLNLPVSRFEGNEILSLLECAPLARRYDIFSGELDEAHSWLDRVHVHWGLDADHREQMSGTRRWLNTWQFGLERLLFGFAMTTDDTFLLNQCIRPETAVEGSQAEVLGRIYRFVQDLKLFTEQLQQPRTGVQWQRWLNHWLDRLFVTGRDRNELRAVDTLRSVAQQLAEETRDLSESQRLDQHVLREWLSEQLSQTQSGQPFLSGGITFCGMVPMRSIPFRIVCLLGMNDEAFPRVRAAAGFDLIAKQPLPGDHDLREDDRYLFLESLMSARDRLYISYQSGDLKHGDSLEPSVLVTALQDLAEVYVPNRSLFTQQPMQVFSRRLYNGSDQALFSYSRDWLPPADIGAGAVPAFRSIALPEQEELLSELDLAQLIRFLQKPAEYLLRHRLDLRLRHYEDIPDDQDLYAYDGLLSWTLRHQLLAHSLAMGTFVTELPDALLAEGWLPVGNTAWGGFHKARKEIQPLFQRLSRLGAGQGIRQGLNVQLGEVTLTGSIEGVHDWGLLRWMPGSFKAKALIATWVEHLALICNTKTPQISRVLSLKRNQVSEFQLGAISPECAGEQLSGLLSLYRLGMQQCLPFYPGSALAWYQATLEEKEPASAAYAVWDDQHYPGGTIPGESQDPYMGLASRGGVIFDQQFQLLAEQVFQPILDQLTEGDLV